MRFMHIADVHLGAAPDHGYSWAKARGKELWEGFRQCIADANERKIDLLLIAGDLFDRKPEVKELNEVNYLFSTLEKTVVVLIAGNRDYLEPSSPYLTYEWNENVITMFSDEMERIRLPELKLEIYGMSYHKREIPVAAADGVRAEKNDYFKILLLHGGDASHIPLGKEQLLESGFDYIALGHQHNPQVYIRNLAVYAGAPCPLGPEDTGAHGYVVGEVQRKKVHISFVELEGRRYCDETIELTEADNPFSLQEKIEGRIQECGAQNMYRLTLCGERDPGFVPNVRECLKYGRILSVMDQSVPAFHLEELCSQYAGRLPARFIESFGEDGPQGVIEEKALYYGLEALLYQGKEGGRGSREEKQNGD